MVSVLINQTTVSDVKSDSYGAAADTTSVMAPEPDHLLEIYLADHLAAATAGVQLAHRIARNNASSPSGEQLHRLASEIEEDRRALERIVAALGFRESKVKEGLAWASEKVGRLKLNGTLRTYSPLSRVVELEALSVGIAGKLALWRSLQSAPQVQARLPELDLEHLVQRAQRQRDEVEEQRVEAAGHAFTRAS